MVLLSSAVLFSGQAMASSLDANFFYFSDSLAESITTSSTHTYFDLSAMMNVDKRGNFQVGWSYSSFSVATTGTADTTYAATEMGPRLGWLIDKNLTWGLFVTYNLQTAATYETTSSNATWRGTSLKGEFGYTPAVSENLFMGAKLVYYAPSYTEQLVGTTTFSTISYSRAIIYPAFSIIYRWQ
jgi:hypothetical protein